MMNNHDCRKNCEERRATTEKPYRFLDSGLSNIYLVGIRYWVCKNCGKQSAEIPALGQLLSVMAKSVVMKPGLLNGEEIRFLRKRVGKKAADFADLVNKTPEHFSKLENDQLPLQEDTDKLIRLTYGMLAGDEKLLLSIMKKVEEWLKSIRGQYTSDVTFKKQSGNWAPLKRAVAA